MEKADTRRLTCGNKKELKTMKKKYLLSASLLTATLALSSCGASNYNSGAVTTGAAMNYDLTSPMAEKYAGQETEFNTEEYSATTENTFMSTVSDPLSTFSIDVDTASYSNIRRMIDRGRDIPADAVRIEEMINYFDYSYPEPKNGEPFSVSTEITDCPWNSDTKLMRIGLKSMDIDLSQRAPMNLVFLIDVSGSMSDDDKLPLVQRSFSILTDQLTPQDRISIVTYAGEDKVVLEGADGNDRQRILDAITHLEAGGSTAGSKGITTAYEIAEKYFIQGGNNRIILATDGDLNVGVTSEAELKALVEKKREGGVFLSVLGFGQGNIKDNKMETLADNGNGAYSYIDSEREARKVLCEEMAASFITVAKDVKIQVEFNPAYIKGYRQIGYENRAMSAEDFNNDEKDAGEIGAGHTVTALYEIVYKDSKMDLTSSDLKYSDASALGTENGELLTVSVRYKAPDSDESKLLTYPVTDQTYTQVMSEDMSFAAAVAEFGMLLRNSAYKGSTTQDSILALVGNCNIENDEYKQEFVQLVKAANLQ